MLGSPFWLIDDTEGITVGFKKIIDIIGYVCVSDVIILIFKCQETSEDWI